VRESCAELLVMGWVFGEACCQWRAILVLRVALAGR
jgi:hypothetical protein